MTLTTRLSFFFLSMLALVLVGFSTTLYFLARNHMYGQAHERLEGALNTLVAAVEVGPEGLEWEKSQHKLDVGLRRGNGQVVWLVSNGHAAVDSAGQQDSVSELALATRRLQELGIAHDRVDWQEQTWFVAGRFLDARSLDKPAPEPHAVINPGEKIYQNLAITAAVPLGPVRAELRYLASILGGLSAVVWLGALFVGRRVCRQALRPVQRMAQSARDMETSDLTERLPVTPTGDELEDLSRSFNGLLDRTQESLESQRRFAGDASHQLRTPLTALLGQIEIALRRDRSPLEYQHVLAAAQRQGKHLQQIVDSLLFLARADAEARLPNLERLDLAAWLPDQQSTWSGRLTSKVLRLAFDEPGPCWVEAQPALLEELVNNLLDNAAKYSGPGTLITLKVSRNDREVILAVEDEGTGVRPEDMPHLFEPFFRSPMARERGVGGVGLGLAIAARIARAFGGGIDAENRSTGGSCFRLHLPALQQYGQSGQNKVEPRQPLESAMSGEHLT